MSLQHATCTLSLRRWCSSMNVQWRAYSTVQRRWQTTPKCTMTNYTLRCPSCSQRRISSSSLLLSSSDPSSSPPPTTTTSSTPPHPIVLRASERVLLTLGAAFTGFIDPSRGDMIAMLGELTGEPALRSMLSRMQSDTEIPTTTHNKTSQSSSSHQPIISSGSSSSSDPLSSMPEGKFLLATRPSINYSKYEIETLASTLPENSFGAAYTAYLQTHGFDPAERAPVRFLADPDVAFVMQRYRQVHDFVHVLSGIPPSIVGETAVKWFEMIQTGLPMTALSAFVAPARLSSRDRQLLWSQYIPWATTAGKQAKNVMCVHFERYLPEPLDQVREKLRFKPFLRR